MIRLANKFDMDAVIELLIDFYRKTRHPLAMDMSNWSRNHVESVLSSIFAGLGFVLISDKNDGLLVAIKQRSSWFNNIFVLSEIMWHGKSKRVGADLIEKYIEIAEGMKDRGEISGFYFNAYGESDFGRYNVSRIATVWGSHG